MSDTRNLNPDALGDLYEALSDTRTALWAIEDSAVEAGFDVVADIIASVLVKANAALDRAHGDDRG